MTGRAETPEQKRAVIERILAAWERAPEIRFGQLLVNANNASTSASAVALFYAEDEALAEAVERFAPRPATAEENFAALKRMAPSLAGVYERAAAKRGIRPWEATEEMAWEECPALRPAAEGRPT